MTYEQFSDLLDDMGITKLYWLLVNYTPFKAIRMEKRELVETEIQNSIENYGKETFYKYFFHSTDKWIWVDGDDSEAVAVSVKDNETLKNYILDAILDDPLICSDIALCEFNSKLED